MLVATKWLNRERVNWHYCIWLFPTSESFRKKQTLNSLWLVTTYSMPVDLNHLLDWQTIYFSSSSLVLVGSSNWKVHTPPPTVMECEASNSLPKIYFFYNPVSLINLNNTLHWTCPSPHPQPQPPPPSHIFAPDKKNLPSQLSSHNGVSKLFTDHTLVLE